MTMLKFSKMHGLGNDFVVIDGIRQNINLSTSQIQFLANRNFGIGCDQLLLVEKPSGNNRDVDFKYRIFNADGSEVAQCGNGVRCFAHFVYNQGLTEKITIAVETNSGIVYPSIQMNGDIRVDMGIPNFKPADIPFIAEKQMLNYSLNLASDNHLEIGVVSIGNPHAVTVVVDIDTAEVAGLGRQIESHKNFPERVNAGFMQILNPNEIKLRVYERGAGETLACGTGACAAVVTGIQRGFLAREVTVFLAGGQLTIAWPKDNESVWMTGPATHVFDGEIAWTTINKQ